MSQTLLKVGDLVEVTKRNHSAYGSVGRIVEIFERRKHAVVVQIGDSNHWIYVMPSSLKRVALTDADEGRYSAT